MHKAFVEAFSDYKVPFNPTFEEFQKRILYKLNISHQMSGICTSERVVLGFVLHTINRYNGILTIYNGGTGVIPTEQRKGIALNLFEFCFPYFLNSGAKRIILEVVTTNHRAINLYEKLGFTFLQTIKCYKNSSPSYSKVNEKIVVKRRNEWIPERYDPLKSFLPCFIDSNEQLRTNFRNEILLEALVEDNLKGFMIFSPTNGRISQIAVHPEMRGHGIGKSLLKTGLMMSKKDELSILNIPETATETHEALLSLGFENQLDQYEMELLI